MIPENHLVPVFERMTISAWLMACSGTPATEADLFDMGYDSDDIAIFGGAAMKEGTARANRDKRVMPEFLRDFAERQSA
jgi:hypothetical protein